MVLLYSPALVPNLQKMTELADRGFCIYEEENSDERAGDQRTLEAYS